MAAIGGRYTLIFLFRALGLVNSMVDRGRRGYEHLQKSKDLLKACFENVNMLK